MNYSKITENLYIGTTPRSDHYETLHQLGISLVINMRVGLPPRSDPHIPPMKTLWLPTIDSPIIPIPIRAFQKGVEAALKVIDQGGVVFTHCSRGRHRGPAMGACILIAQGMPMQAAMQLIKQQRPISDLQIWYIQRRIIKFEHTWKDKK